MSIMQNIQRVVIQKNQNGQAKTEQGTMVAARGSLQQKGQNAVVGVRPRALLGQKARLTRPSPGPGQQRTLAVAGGGVPFHQYLKADADSMSHGPSSLSQHQNNFETAGVVTHECYRSQSNLASPKSPKLGPRSGGGGAEPGSPGSKRSSRSQGVAANFADEPPIQAQAPPRKIRALQGRQGGDPMKEQQRRQLPSTYGAIKDGGAPQRGGPVPAPFATDAGRRAGWGSVYSPEEFYEQLLAFQRSVDEARKAAACEPSAQEGKNSIQQLLENFVASGNADLEFSATNEISKKRETQAQGKVRRGSTASTAVEGEGESSAKKKPLPYHDTFSILRKLTQNQYLMDWTDARDCKRLASKIAQNHYNNIQGQKKGNDGLVANLGQLEQADYNGSSRKEPRRARTVLQTRQEQTRTSQHRDGSLAGDPSPSPTRHSKSKQTNRAGQQPPPAHLLSMMHSQRLKMNLKRAEENRKLTERFQNDLIKNELFHTAVEGALEVDKAGSSCNASQARPGCDVRVQNLNKLRFGKAFSGAGQGKAKFPADSRQKGQARQKESLQRNEGQPRWPAPGSRMASPSFAGPGARPHSVMIVEPPGSLGPMTQQQALGSEQFQLRDAQKTDSVRQLKIDGLNLRRRPHERQITQIAVGASKPIKISSFQAVKDEGIAYTDTPSEQVQTAYLRKTPGGRSGQAGLFSPPHSSIQSIYRDQWSVRGEDKTPTPQRAGRTRTDQERAGWTDADRRDRGCSDQDANPGYRSHSRKQNDASHLEDTDREPRVGQVAALGRAGLPARKYLNTEGAMDEPLNGGLRGGARPRGQSLGRGQPNRGGQPQVGHSRAGENKGRVSALAGPISNELPKISDPVPRQQLPDQERSAALRLAVSAKETVSKGASKPRDTLRLPAAGRPGLPPGAQAFAVPPPKHDGGRGGQTNSGEDQSSSSQRRDGTPDSLGQANDLYPHLSLEVGGAQVHDEAAMGNAWTLTQQHSTNNGFPRAKSCDRDSDALPSPQPASLQKMLINMNELQGHVAHGEGDGTEQHVSHELSPNGSPAPPEGVTRFQQCVVLSAPRGLSRRQVGGRTGRPEEATRRLHSKLVEQPPKAGTQEQTKNQHAEVSNRAPAKATSSMTRPSQDRVNEQRGPVLFAITSYATPAPGQAEGTKASFHISLPAQREPLGTGRSSCDPCPTQERLSARGPPSPSGTAKRSAAAICYQREEALSGHQPLKHTSVQSKAEYVSGHGLHDARRKSLIGQIIEAYNTRAAVRDGQSMERRAGTATTCREARTVRPGRLEEGVEIEDDFSLRQLEEMYDGPPVVNGEIEIKDDVEEGLARQSGPLVVPKSLLDVARKGKNGDLNERMGDASDRLHPPPSIDRLSSTERIILAQILHDVQVSLARPQAKAEKMVRVGTPGRFAPESTALQVLVEIVRAKKESQQQVRDVLNQLREYEEVSAALGQQRGGSRTGPVQLPDSDFEYQQIRRFLVGVIPIVGNEPALEDLDQAQARKVKNSYVQRQQLPSNQQTRGSKPIQGPSLSNALYNFKQLTADAIFADQQEPTPWKSKQYRRSPRVQTLLAHYQMAHARQSSLYMTTNRGGLEQGTRYNDPPTRNTVGSQRPQKQNKPRRLNLDLKREGALESARGSLQDTLRKASMRRDSMRRSSVHRREESIPLQHEIQDLELFGVRSKMQGRDRQSAQQQRESNADSAMRKSGQQSEQISTGKIKLMVQQFEAGGRQLVDADLGLRCRDQTEHLHGSPELGPPQVRRGVGSPDDARSFAIQRLTSKKSSAYGSGSRGSQQLGARPDLEPGVLHTQGSHSKDQAGRNSATAHRGEHLADQEDEGGKAEHLRGATRAAIVPEGGRRTTEAAVSGSDADLREQSGDRDGPEKSTLLKRNVIDCQQNRENSATSEGDSPYSAAKDALTNMSHFPYSATGMAELDTQTLAPPSAATPHQKAELATGSLRSPQARDQGDLTAATRHSNLKAGSSPVQGLRGRICAPLRQAKIEESPVLTSKEPLSGEQQLRSARFQSSGEGRAVTNSGQPSPAAIGLSKASALDPERIDSTLAAARRQTREGHASDLSRNGKAPVSRWHGLQVQVGEQPRASGGAAIGKARMMDLENARTPNTESAYGPRRRSPASNLHKETPLEYEPIRKPELVVFGIVTKKPPGNAPGPKAERQVPQDTSQGAHKLHASARMGPPQPVRKQPVADGLSAVAWKKIGSQHLMYSHNNQLLKQDEVLLSSRRAPTPPLPMIVGQNFPGQQKMQQQKESAQKSRGGRQSVTPATVKVVAAEPRGRPQVLGGALGSFGSPPDSATAPHQYAIGRLHDQLRLHSRTPQELYPSSHMIAGSQSLSNHVRGQAGRSSIQESGQGTTMGQLVPPIMSMHHTDRGEELVESPLYSEYSAIAYRGPGNAYMLPPDVHLPRYSALGPPSRTTAPTPGLLKNEGPPKGRKERPKLARGRPEQSPSNAAAGQVRTEAQTASSATYRIGGSNWV